MSTPQSPTAVMAAIDPAAGETAEKLRAAICSEAYEDVLGLLAEYGQQLERVRREAGASRAERLVTEANHLLHWAKVTVFANRAHTQAKLSQLDQAAGYLPAKNGKSRRWRLDA